MNRVPSVLRDTGCQYLFLRYYSKYERYADMRTFYVAFNKKIPVWCFLVCLLSTILVPYVLE